MASAQRIFTLVLLPLLTLFVLFGSDALTRSSQPRRHRLPSLADLPSWADVPVVFGSAGPGPEYATVDLGDEHEAADTRPLWQPSRPSEFPPIERPEHKACVSLPLDVLPAESAARLGKIRRHSKPLVGASIAVHPPKFYSAAMFLEQFVACPGAVQAMMVVLVFSNEQEMNLFRRALACLSPSVPPEAYEPIVAVVPRGGWPRAQGVANQIIAAYKKWHGVMYMMDLPEADRPDYGLLMDAELLLFDGHGDGVTGRHCSVSGVWSRFRDRIREQEVSKTFPAAKVSDTLTTYDFGKYKKSGKDYDQQLIRGNAGFVANQYRTCTSKGCAEIRRQIDECLWSWWTDIPWTNLTVVGRMTRKLAKVEDPEGWTWRNLSAQITWQRFEYVGYQQWCAMTEGFTFRDVTNITGYAKWGSYMEDPLPGAKLNLLKPMWISGQALERVEQETLPPLSEEAPPFLVFHADQGRARSAREEVKQTYSKVLLDLAKAHGLKEWTDREAVLR